MCATGYMCFFCFFFQAEDGIRDGRVTGVQTCALPICYNPTDVVRRVIALARITDDAGQFLFTDRLGNFDCELSKQIKVVIKQGTIDGGVAKSAVKGTFRSPKPIEDACRVLDS